MSRCVTGLTDRNRLYSVAPGIFFAYKRQQGMKANRLRFHRFQRTLVYLFGLGLSAPLSALNPGSLNALDQLDRQVERTVSRQIERQLEETAKRVPDSAGETDSSGGLSSLASVANLPARLSIRSASGREVFADVEVEDGWRAVERQWLVTVEADELHHFKQPGITVMEQTSLDELGLTVLRFQASQNLDSREQLQRLLPQALVERLDRNHIYQPEATSGVARGSTTDTQDPQPSANATVPVAPLCAAPVTIGMVDTAINTEHPAFAETTVRQRDFLADLELSEASRPPTDHGTAVASRLSGRTGTTAATRLPAATLVSASVFFDRQASIAGATLLHLVEALDWLQASEVALINISMAGPDNRVLATVIRRLLVRGTPVVAAVGNGGPASPMLYPAGYPGVIGVTAVDQDRKIYRWANQGQQVDFAAAGVDVAVAVTDGQYGTQSGTSLAAPVISGQLACALADTSFEQALTGLKQHGIDLGDSGRDPVYGYGLVRDSH